MDNNPGFTEDDIYPDKPQIIGGKPESSGIKKIFEQKQQEAKPFVPVDNDPGYDEDNIFGEAKVYGKDPSNKAVSQPQMSDCSLKDSFVAFIGLDFM